MDNNIILNNITQSEITIDMITVPVVEGFKGVYCLPKGLHHVNITTDAGKEIGFWCYFKDDEGIIAKSFNAERQIFEDWNDAEAAKCAKLALEEELDDFMIVYPRDAIDVWMSLVQCIEEYGSVPSIKLSGKKNQSFTELFNEVHKGDIASAIAEFQYAFVKMAIEPPEDRDNDAIERWKEMMETIYNATKEEIDGNSQFFIDWISFLLKQFEIMPDISFQRDEKSMTYKIIVKNSAALCDRLMNSSYDGTVRAGKRLKIYLEQRGAQL